METDKPLMKLVLSQDKLKIKVYISEEQSFEVIVQRKKGTEGRAFFHIAGYAHLKKVMDFLKETGNQNLKAILVFSKEVMKPVEVKFSFLRGTSISRDKSWLR
jgi:hypothetical protein